MEWSHEASGALTAHIRNAETVQNKETFFFFEISVNDQNFNLNPCPCTFRKSLLEYVTFSILTGHYVFKIIGVLIDLM